VAGAISWLLLWTAVSVAGEAIRVSSSPAAHQATYASAFLTDAAADESCGLSSPAGCDPAAICHACDTPTSQFWARAEYLFWWTQGNRVPPLLTTSPDGTARGDAGVLGLATTAVPFGDDRLDENGRSGGRLRLGYQLCGPEASGLVAELIGLGDGSHTRYVTAQSAGSPILARPFVDATTGLEDAQLVAYPNLVEGRFGVRTSSELYSADLLWRKNWRAGTRGRAGLLGGYRYLRFREGLALDENLISRDPSGIVQVGTLIDVHDSFQAANDFHGGEVGVDVTFDRGPWSLDVVAKLGMGNVHQVIRIDGTTQVTTPGDPPVNRSGGLLALPSNIGTVSHDRLALLPELAVTCEWNFAPRWSLTGGYTGLLLTSAVRSGDQIDRTIDPSQLSPLLNVATGAPATTGRPHVPFRETTFWAQGLHFGVQFTR
jgi:hypothetical protein